MKVRGAPFPAVGAFREIEGGFGLGHALASPMIGAQNGLSP